MLIDCPNCSARVDGEFVAKIDHYDPEVGPPGRYSFLKCPSCGNALVAVQEDYGRGWDTPTRVYPPKRRAGYKIPSTLRASFDEVLLCHQVKAHIATALMCRRTLEAVCREHYGNVRNLATGLARLHKDGVIDGRLLEWSQALRGDGNLAAHDAGTPITREDAKDLVDFTEAILNYVYVLHDRFEAYKKRRDERDEATRKKAVRKKIAKKKATRKKTKRSTGKKATTAAAKTR